MFKIEFLQIHNNGVFFFLLANMKSRLTIERTFAFCWTKTFKIKNYEIKDIRVHGYNVSVGICLVGKNELTLCSIGRKFAVNECVIGV